MTIDEYRVQVKIISMPVGANQKKSWLRIRHELMPE